MHIDIKQTMWIRYHIDDEEVEKKLRKELKENEAHFDAHTFIQNNKFRAEDLLDSAEDISLDDNDGFSTAEVWEGEEQIWGNGE